MEKYLNFKNTTEYIEEVKAIFSRDNSGEIWHEINNNLIGTYIMVLDNLVIAKDTDPTKISPLPTSNIFKSENFNVGDYIYYDELSDTLHKINPPEEQMKSFYDGQNWIITTSEEKQKQYWLNRCLEIKRKIEEYKSLGFEGRTEIIELEKELEKYKLLYSASFLEDAIALDKHISSTKPSKGGEI